MKRFYSHCLGLLLSANSHSQNALRMNPNNECGSGSGLFISCRFTGRLERCCSPLYSVSSKLQLTQKYFSEDMTAVGKYFMDDCGLRTVIGFSTRILILFSTVPETVTPGVIYAAANHCSSNWQWCSVVWQRSVISAFPPGALNQIVYKNVLLICKVHQSVFDVNGTGTMVCCQLVLNGLPWIIRVEPIVSVSSGFETLVRYNADGSFQF